MRRFGQPFQRRGVTRLERGDARAHALDLGAPADTALPTPEPAVRHNTAALGDILYTDYVHLFQLAGMILLVAMIGAIVLTLRHKEGVKRQNISEQNARTPATAVEVRKVKPGQGI